MDVPIFIDFEASSLEPDSYPIEVAWNAPDGSVESYLIRPAAGWTDWSDYAELEIQHISGDMLSSEGRDAAWVAARMNEALAGRTVHSDAPEFDERWLRRLFEAGDRARDDRRARRHPAPLRPGVGPGRRVGAHRPRMA